LVLLLTRVFLNDPATTEIYPLSLHDALPIYEQGPGLGGARGLPRPRRARGDRGDAGDCGVLRVAQRFERRPRRRPRAQERALRQDRKSTRLNSSHEWISYAVFCLKKKTKTNK